jgi:hypothetical protein
MTQGITSLTALAKLTDAFSQRSVSFNKRMKMDLVSDWTTARIGCMYVANHI